jgi:Tfp pilus assembly protein PilN
MSDIPAFPLEIIYTQENEKFNGMTLRDYFAAKAMQAMLSSPEFLVVVTADQAIGNNAKERVSNVSFAYADEMMKAREV